MKAQIVSFHCVLRNRIGHVISKSFNREVLNQIDGEKGNLSGLIEGLQNIRAGERREIFVPASQAYGLYDPELVVKILRKRLSPFGKKLEIGNQVMLKDDVGRVRSFQVVDATEKLVTLDGNHPLAGQDLIFEIEATSAREATPNEIAEARVEVPKVFLH